MKLDGNSSTFDYDSDLWSNKEIFQSNSLDLDDIEAKLASYWTLPFTELRLGMKYKYGGESEDGTFDTDSDTTIKWTTFKYSASSLHDVIADGKYKNTSFNNWARLIPDRFYFDDFDKVSTLLVIETQSQTYNTILCYISCKLLPLLLVLLPIYIYIGRYVCMYMSMYFFLGRFQYTIF